jgi:hypothetical protein
VAMRRRIKIRLHRQASQGDFMAHFFILTHVPSMIGTTQIRAMMFDQNFSSFS